MSPAKSPNISGFFATQTAIFLGDFSLYQNTDVKSPFSLCG